ncbi:MAG: hypothetical protein A2913_00900 [Parcubacteria group bacterium RIFCSPLOWO2_01_FULL_40_65]|nr:MAG: hypothetical protein A2734_02960 [Parcubacteria group bacterium RIFCSPHIGHO2_01_FULL_40_30]OHB18933.1 MAG: hypothetical protein A3D40_00425 [Parcubacteria group bacterium RIFCSPHIGHO2_02_FULL_40_12]OHB21712.1 MAG: hypothetical protein A2913_00900 [Parcubacteria group bacterium RIFCSPLOWO2_01_FULL_40_65]OHB22775.1 MAG: hypothetical protein A3I22_02680 [Parcubacteria group bacterium RIFCSPLOWO2_02_FULL_40_12]OHB23960.1 MAG: hypothetical protein A3F96_00245 [Parcubacteria group bacterium R
MEGPKFESEKPDLGKRLAEISEQPQNLKEALKSMEGLEMRKILDKEYELNSAQSPIDATDPNRRREYDEWVHAFHESRQATQELKKDLERRIEARKMEIYKLGEEQRKIEG